MQMTEQVERPRPRAGQPRKDEARERDRREAYGQSNMSAPDGLSIDRRRGFGRGSRTT
jgi:hypothetical protein